MVTKTKLQIGSILNICKCLNQSGPVGESRCWRPPGGPADLWAAQYHALFQQEHHNNSYPAQLSGCFRYQAGPAGSPHSPAGKHPKTRMTFWLWCHFVLVFCQRTSFLIWSQEKELYELEQLYETITGSMETATSGADHAAARDGLLRSLEKIRESLSVPSGDGCSETGEAQRQAPYTVPSKTILLFQT